MIALTLICTTPYIQLPNFPAHKTHPDFFVRNFRKNNDECILILVIYWKKTGLLHTKVINHNIYLFITEPQKIIFTATKIIPQLIDVQIL
jgi:hypothetical protein